MLNADAVCGQTVGLIAPVCAMAYGRANRVAIEGLATRSLYHATSFRDQMSEPMEEIILRNAGEMVRGCF
jgi:hypothetical protein